MDHPNNSSLNVNRIGRLDQTTESSMHLIMTYFLAPGMQEDIRAIPTKEQMRDAILQIQSTNPVLIQTILRAYMINPRTLAQFTELANQLHQLDPSLFHFDFYLYGTLHIGSIKISLGPTCKYEPSSGKSSVGIKVALDFDPANEGGINLIGSSCSLSKKNFKATGSAETDLTEGNVERSVTVQTNISNETTIGVQLKNDNSKVMSFFAPSNVVKNGKFVVSHRTNDHEIETTASVLPLQSTKDSAKSDLRHEKQIENQPTFAETKVEKRETQRVFVQQTAPAPVYVIRRKETIVKLSLLAVLVCLLLFFVAKITSFLKNERVRQGF